MMRGQLKTRGVVLGAFLCLFAVANSVRADGDVYFECHSSCKKKPQANRMMAFPSGDVTCIGGHLCSCITDAGANIKSAKSFNDSDFSSTLDERETYFFGEKSLNTRTPELAGLEEDLVRFGLESPWIACRCEGPNQTCDFFDDEGNLVVEARWDQHPSCMNAE